MRLGGLCGLVGVGLFASSAAAQVSFQRTFIRNVPVDAFAPTPQAIALADLTGDARDDIIVVAAEEDQIAVYRNNGSGGFPGTPATFATGAGPVAVVAADFNGDGLLDVATANNDAGTITVQLGDGTGNFNSPRDFPVDDGPVGLVAVDLNNNGMPDLAVLSAETVHPLRSNGDGTFSNFDPASVEILCADGVAIAAGLFDANTNQDLAVSCDIAGQVSVLLGNGNGTFQAAQLFSAGAGPAGLVVAPLFQANTRDIAVVQADNFGDENVTLLLGNGQGGFTFETTTAGVDSNAITAADFNLDGRLDLAVTNVGEAQSVAILLNDPTSTDNGFRFLPNVPGTSLGADAAAFAIQRGNINGDGLPDLIALGEDQNGPLIGVLINTSSQLPSPSVTATPTPSFPPGTPVTATPTPTFVFPYVQLSVESVRGRPGDLLDLTVSLSASGVEVAATAIDIVFGLGEVTIDPKSCRANPPIMNAITATTPTLPFTGPAVRLFLLPTADADPLPNGPLLTCNFQLGISAFPGQYGIYPVQVGAYGRNGVEIPVIAADYALLEVSLFPGLPPVPEASDGDGCSIGHEQDTPMSLWLGAAALLFLAKRRRN